MKSFVRMSLLLTFVVLGRPAIASAQLFEPLRFTAPFAFEAGHLLMPADTYVLAPLASDLGGQLYTLSNTRMQVTFVWADGLGASPDPKPTSNEVIFAVDHATGHYVM